MLRLLRKMIPGSLVAKYHAFLAWLAAVWYWRPSNDMIVIGVTGTNGKTTTAYLIAKALEAEGIKTGCATTALFKVGDKEWLNDTKMTMLGRFSLQRLLRQMANAGCQYAVVETSSQGILQYRHSQIAYDICVFTNLTPEHLEAHGGFEAYKKAKQTLFEHLAALPPKRLEGKMTPRAAVLNRDDAHAQDFAIPGIPHIVWYGIVHEECDLRGVVRGFDVETGRNVFELNGRTIQLRIPSVVNVYNALATLGVVEALHLSASDAIARLEAVPSVPGRFERIDEGQPWTVIVDYAPEPVSLEALYQTIETLPHQRIIHVLGSCGGGRDVARRPVLGRVAGERADIVIVTNEDPYDDDPMQIIEQVAKGAEDAGKRRDEHLFLILDRKEAIQKAMDFAQNGDLVLLTGKGCEQGICVARGKKLAWDERTVARSAIRASIAKR